MHNKNHQWIPNVRLFGDTSANEVSYGFNSFQNLQEASNFQKSKKQNRKVMNR